MAHHLRRESIPTAPALLDTAVLRAWLMRTWIGRLLLAGLAIKLAAYLVAFFTSTPAAALGRLDRAANLALAAAGGDEPMGHGGPHLRTGWWQ